MVASGHTMYSFSHVKPGAIYNSPYDCGLSYCTNMIPTVSHFTGSQLSLMSELVKKKTHEYKKTRLEFCIFNL